MNRLALVITALAFSIAIIAINTFIGRATLNETREQITRDLRHRANRQLQFVSESVRNDLMEGNIRGARNALEILKEKELFLAYQIRRKDEVLETSPRFDQLSISPDIMIHEVPILFSKGGPKWGAIIFKSSLVNIRTTISSLSDRIYSGSVMLGVCSFLLIAVVFVVFWRSSTKLVPIFRSFLEDGAREKPGHLARLFWGPLISMMTTTSDQVKASHRQRQESERNSAIAQTARCIAHDLKQPFVMLRDTIENFQHKVSDPKKIEQSLDEVSHALDKSDVMIQDLLDVSRESAFDCEPVPLWQVIEGALRQSRRRATVPIDLQISLLSTKMPLASPVRIVRPFANIIANAFEAIAIQGKGMAGLVSIQSHDKIENGNPFVEISIENDGPALPAGALTNLFESVFSSGKAHGTGLGLPSSKKVIALHGGSIVVENMEGEAGVRFIVRIPASTSADHHPDSYPTTCVDLDEVHNSGRVDELACAIKNFDTPILILHLDDQKSSFDSVCTRVRSAGIDFDQNFRIVHASTIDEALELVAREPISHFLVDLDLGVGVDGFEFISWLSKNDPSHRPVMILSNRLFDEDKVRAGEHHVSVVSAKPISVSLFLDFLVPDDEVSDSCSMRIEQKKQLVVYHCDDSLPQREHFKYLIDSISKETGIQILFRSFENGEQLVCALDDAVPDFVFTDLHMGRTGGVLDGFDVSSSVSSRYASSCVYIVSNDDAETIENKVLASGAVGILDQPVCCFKISLIFAQLLSDDV